MTRSDAINKHFRELAGGVSQSEIVAVFSPRNFFAEVDTVIYQNRHLQYW